MAWVLIALCRTKDVALLKAKMVRFSQVVNIPEIRI